ncbi:ACT domain-containing protein [Methylobacterium nonmethylotrophicum]|uniref:ACT domain-containing protein n=1 Tax=Methylobacterium nonmethylotrophicum TaxID=1141884 RepID=A0A4Z0NXE8_9HYPH|nr:ACT domain-containing protein [Methylobacterium nonmethylotrophicum]TGE02540.1 ACT domain-containing protein [Methylobacterium nonmethylotrophicum]
MSGETDLRRLLSGMRPELRPGTYVFVLVADGRVPAGLAPVLTFREAEGLTLILTEDEAARAGLPGAFPCRWITLAVHSSLAAVGFLAAVTQRLAEAGIAVNAVSAVHHDHLFVPVARAEEAMRLLRDLAGGTAC